MIHKFTQGGLYIAVDVYSGAVHLLDKAAYQLLDYTFDGMAAELPQEAAKALSLEFTLDELNEAYTELYELYKSGKLHGRDEYAPYAEQMVNATVKSMCLNIAHDCNLRCEYCFAAKGDFGGERVLMPLEVGKKAIDFLIEKSVGRRNLELDFFGGEPLMNFEAVKGVVEYARSLEAEHGKRFRFTITTNGLLLSDDKIDFINKEMSNVVLSIDGRKEINDKLRTRVDGSGCYDAILPKYKKLVEQRGDKDYYVRATFTKHNLDFNKDILHLYHQGFNQLSEEPVVSDPKLDYSITEADLPLVFEEYERLAELLLQNSDLHFFHFMLDLDGGPCAIRRLRGCSSGNEYIAITPEGDIYPCHQFVGERDWKMGSVLDGSFNTEIKGRFAHANIYYKSKCADCWAKFYCSGGCNANNYQYEGDILKPHSIYCELEKKRLECALYLACAKAVQVKSEELRWICCANFD